MNRLRFVAKSLAHGAMEWSGRLRRQRRRLRGKLIVLTYHSFCATWPRGLFSSLPIDRFERQVRFIQAHFTLVSLQQGLTYLQQARIDHKPWVAITIDDGFRDNYTHAWPILQRYAVPATIFLATDFIDTGRPPWPTQLVDILDRTRLSGMESPFRANFKRMADRTTVMNQLMELWRSLPADQRFARIDELRKHLQVDNLNRYFPLTWDQIREMRSSGIFFGSHTAYHGILPMLTDSGARMEIAESKKRLEKELQEPCLDFAYPNGDYSTREKQLLKSECFRLAVTQEPGVNEASSDTFALCRIEIPYHDPLVTFRARVSYCL